MVDPLQNKVCNNKVRIIHTDRHGGVSGVPFHSLNLSYGVGDDARSVSENRKRFKTRLAVNHLLSAKQVHGDSLFIAGEGFHGDREVEGFDALLTDRRDIGLMIQQADCQAVTLFDPAHPAIAAIHCGWKGSVLNILGKTVQAMTAHYGSLASTLQATISPSLGPCCAEFIHHAQELPSSFLAFQRKENYFDFWQISKMQLTRAGLDGGNIHLAGQCTSCSADFFSYRRSCRQADGKTGRCATGITLAAAYYNIPNSPYNMRLLVVEDDKKIASFLEKGLQEAGFTIDVCHDGLDGLSLALTEPYEAAVVDIMLPGLDGLSLIEKIRARGIETPVLILSARQSVDDRIEGLQRGGDDYMIKPFSFNELLARIQALLRRGQKSTEAAALTVGELQLDPFQREVSRQGKKIELPAKEYALLELLMRNPGRVLAKTSILERIYDYNFDPQTNVVDVLVCRLRNRIDKEYQKKLIHTVRGMGYVLRVE